MLAAIVAYDPWHKRHPFTIVLMAGCRAQLYLFAGNAARHTASHYLLVKAGGMAAYVFGINLLARHESGMGRPPKWPVLLLLMLVVPAGLRISADNFAATMVGVVLFTVWLVVAVSQLWRAEPQTRRAVGRLLAVIVLADWLQVAVVAPSFSHVVVWATLLGLTLWLQRRIPAT